MSQFVDVYAFPASFAQHRLWFFDRLQPGHPAYNVPSLIKLQGRLDSDAMAQAIDEIIWRHESLRTTFDVQDGELLQIIAAEPASGMEVVDLCHLPRHHREQEAYRLASLQAKTSFDLVKGPLFIATLYRLRDEEHWLMLTMHHIITDGWSMGILFQELAELYHAFSNGKDSPLPELALQYADYSDWQAKWLQGEVLQQQLQYWREQLAGPPPVLQMPTDRPRPAMETYSGRTDVFLLPPALKQALTELSHREGATLFMTLLAGFNTVLSRWTGQEDIAVGSPIANRTRTEVKGIIGFFVNTLVMRSDLSGSPTFRELLARTKRMALDAYANQDVPLERVVEAVQPDRNLSHAPLFQVVFVLQNAPMDYAELPGLTMNYAETDSGTAQFDMSLSIKDTRQGLYCKINYNTDLFDEATIARLMGHFRTVLEGAVADPDQPVHALPMLTEAEREQVTREWNDTHQEFPTDVLLHELFEAQVERMPDRVAVVFEGAMLTYRELNRRANQLARHLQSIGVGRGSRVGVHLGRSLELMVSLLGTQKAGAAYVPLDPGYPTDRLAFLMKDAELTVLLTMSGIEKTLFASVPQILFLDRASVAIAAQDDSNLPRLIGAEDPAYILYTSGSTGRPKGALVPHRAVCNHMLWLQREFSIGADDAMLQKNSLNFDGSVLEMYWPLLAGARLVLAHPDGHFDPDYMAKTIRREGVTLLVMVPSVLSLLLDSPHLAACTSLRYVIAGGEVLTRELQQRLHNVLPDAELVNIYGPTEACINATFHVCAKGATGTLPIGRPIDNVQVYILDERLQPVPVGVPGELHIGGRGIGLGYLNRPELTDKTFIANPFGQEGDRLYKTGDLACWLPSGEIEYVGRRDHQVKLRGLRIELGEIEAVLLAQEMVREAVVLVVNAALVAYVVPEPGWDLEALRAQLQRQVPAYMVPSQFVLLEQMPLSPNGKADRLALPAPQPLGAATREPVAPRNETERRVADLWSQLLKQDVLDVRASFFELGGHSLLAMQLMMRVREQFGVDLPLRQLFERPALADFAARILELELSENAAHQEAAPIERIARDGEIPLSFAQQRMWFLDQLEPDSSLYNIPFAVRVQGVIDASLLGRCFQEIVSRHEILRTTFANHSGQPVQVIAPSLDLPLTEIDLRDLPQEEREAEAGRLTAAEAQTSFDLENGPLLRVTVVHLAERESLLLLTMHHMIADGWSLGVLMKEIGVLYQAFAQGRPAPLGELPLQYADYASWQRAFLQGDVLEGQIEYWKEQLKGPLPVLQLPTDRPRPAQRSIRGAHRTLVLPRTLTQALQELSRRESTSLYMTLLTAFLTLLHRYTGETDLLVGSPVAGRTRGEMEGLIGCFVNTLVMRGDLAGDPAFREAMRRVRETVLAAFAHQDAPFEKIVETLQPDRAQAGSPLFQAMFVLQNAPSQPLQLPGLTLTPDFPDNGTAKFDLTLVMAETAEGLRATLEYSTDLFAGETAERMLRQLQTLLQAVVEDPTGKLSTLPILTEAEREQLLAAGNNTRTEYPRDASVAELFEEQARQTPDAAAITFGGWTLTYRELDERAHELACRLQAMDVQAGCYVAVSAEPSNELIIAMLAALKCGAAYVPLDPSYPQERLAYMLADSGASVLLTTSDLASRFAGCGVSIVSLDAAHPTVATLLPNAWTPDHPLCVIYTSGSTGRPKGVLVPHRGIVRLVKGNGNMNFQPGERVAQTCNTSFDPMLLEVWGTLLNGAELVGISRDTLLAPQKLAEELRRERIDILITTTALLNQTARVVPDAFATLRWAVFGGEAADPQRVRDILAHGKPQHLFNGYGPTENTMLSTFYEIEHVPADATSLPIGTPVANSDAYVLDAHLQPVPVGVPGELCVGGDGLALGYLNRPEQTEERFIPHPFAADGRLYRTGDLVRRRADGQLEFLGRLDQQVKIRGFRMELNEIEAVLRKQDGIVDAVVIAREDQAGDKRLAAYLAAGENALTAEKLRAALLAELPEYLVPAAWVFLDALPLTANGKVDLQALPSPTADHLIRTADRVAPRNPVEAKLAELFSELLGIDSISVTDSFFHLGGHSMLAMRLIAGIQQAFGCELPVSALFQASTVEQLAECVSRSAGSSDNSSLIALQPHGKATPLFFVHPIGGTVFCYAGLARELGADQPFYAFQAVGIDSITEMAKQYLQELRTVQPVGPYRLGGWSLGGVIAYEMARQLRAAGEEIASLHLLDSFVPQPHHAFTDSELALLFVRDLIGATGGELPAFDPSELDGLTAEQAMNRLLTAAREHGLLAGTNLSADHFAALYRVFCANSRANAAYRPEPLDVPATLFRAAESPTEHGWERYLPERLQIIDLPGNHFTMLTEQVHALAAHLRNQQ